MSPDLFWIPGPWRGRLAIAARPRGGDWLEDEIVGWNRAGLEVIVSLLEDEEAAQLQLDHEANAARGCGIEFISFPIPDRGVPQSETAATALIQTIVAALEKGKTIAVHCRQGIGRSGLIAIQALMRSGLSLESAVEVVSAARGLTVPETPLQAQWLEHSAQVQPAA